MKSFSASKIGANITKIGNEEMPDRVRWIRSYVVKEADAGSDRYALDPESIREHARRVGMPGKEIFPIINPVVIRADPTEANAAG